MRNNQTHPYLSRNYVPVYNEIKVHDLKIIGKLPKDLGLSRFRGHFINHIICTLVINSLSESH